MRILACCVSFSPNQLRTKNCVLLFSLKQFLFRRNTSNFVHKTVPLLNTRKSYVNTQEAYCPTVAARAVSCPDGEGAGSGRVGVPCPGPGWGAGSGGDRVGGNLSWLEGVGAGWGNSCPGLGQGGSEYPVLVLARGSRVGAGQGQGVSWGS